MTALADRLWDLVYAHDRIAIVVIMLVVVGIVALWMVKAYQFAQDEETERARLTVGLLPEQFRKGA